MCRLALRDVIGIAARPGLGLDRGHLRLGAGDDLGHIEKIEAQMVEIGRYFLAANRRLDALDGGENHVGVGVAVAAGVFGQEPAAALGLHDRRADRLVIRFGRRRG